MKKRRLAALFTAVIMLISFCATGYAEETAMHPQEAEAKQYSDVALKTMIKVYSQDIAENYYYGAETDELLYAVICSAIEEGRVDIHKAVEKMIASLGDEHAVFYTAKEYAELYESVSGEFAGLGVTMTQDEKGIIIISVIDGSPAMKAGIMEGDYIVEVGGVSTAGLDTAKVRELAIGRAGTEVTLKLMRGETEVSVTCIREIVKLSNIETEYLTDDIAYLKILQFARNTPEEIKAFLEELKSKKVEKLVIDVRDNPGGDIEAATAIASLFIRSGILAELRYKDETKNRFIKSNNFYAPKLKTVLLVNENSASASEFLATAFKERNAAKLIGTKTYGKGSMQSLIQLITGAGMKYTIGEFYSIKGERINKVGVMPHIVVENTTVAVNESEFVPIDYKKIDEAGKNGEMTLALEQRLNVLGLFSEEPDDVFDEKTTEAVKELQLALGYERTGIPGFYEYLFINDFNYEFDMVVDKQLDAAIEYLEK